MLCLTSKWSLSKISNTKRPFSQWLWLSLKSGPRFDDRRIFIHGGHFHTKGIGKYLYLCRESSRIRCSQFLSTLYVTRNEIWTDKEEDFSFQVFISSSFSSSCCVSFSISQFFYLKMTKRSRKNFRNAKKVFVSLAHSEFRKVLVLLKNFFFVKGETRRKIERERLKIMNSWPFNLGLSYFILYSWIGTYLNGFIHSSNAHAFKCDKTFI